jgi:uncharacterized protein (TIGR00369 family)
MPVNPSVHQPAGLLHGGASVVLAESVGSVASFFLLMISCSGTRIEISANHLKSIREGGLWNCTHNSQRKEACICGN